MVNSGSAVYDPQYYNWQTMLDFTKSIVNNSLPFDSRISLINYAGCDQSFTLKQCQEQGQLDKVFGFTDYNDTEVIYDRIASIGPSDVNGGSNNWVDEALTVALDEFEENSYDDRSKMIILFVTGKPSINSAPCNTFSPYISPTLRALRELSVEIITIGIDGTGNYSNQLLGAEYVDTYYRCLVENFETDFYYASDYNALPLLLPQVKNDICTQTPELIINEVFISSNNIDLVFIEIYNPSIDISLKGYSISGLINYNITENIIIEQGQYFVISTMNLSIIDASQDLLISPSFRNLEGDELIGLYYTYTYFDILLLDANGIVMDYVERNPLFFPVVARNYSHELQNVAFDNSAGINWRQSCYRMSK